jgi:phosphoribosylanthranilate isomerase
MTAVQPMRVKICGISDAAAFDAAAEAGADWIGFVFFPPSPRAVTPAQAADISPHRAGGPLRVGLFVDADEDAIAQAAEAARLDAVQLYGASPPAASLREKLGVQVWRAVGVTRRADLPAQPGDADALVIEPKPPPGATRPGGNAVSLDWAMLRGWTAPLPWLLGGGLTPDNVAAAIGASGASAVDVSSGVERAPGRKDPDLIRRFVAAARGA